jgi:hypothetical protein
VFSRSTKNVPKTVNARPTVLKKVQAKRNTVPLRNAMVRALNSLDDVPNALQGLRAQLTSTAKTKSLANMNINILLASNPAHVLESLGSKMLNSIVKKYVRKSMANKDLRFGLLYRVNASGTYMPVPELKVAQTAFKALAKALDVPLDRVEIAPYLMINPASTAGRSSVAGAMRKVLQDQETAVTAEQTRLLQALKAAVNTVGPRVKNMLHTTPGHRSFLNHVKTLQYTPQNLMRPGTSLMKAEYEKGLLKPLINAAGEYNVKHFDEARLIRTFADQYDRTIKTLEAIATIRREFNAAANRMEAAGLPLPTLYELQRDPKDLRPKDPLYVLEAMKAILEAHAKNALARPASPSRSPARSPSRSPSRSPPRSRASSPSRSRAASPARAARPGTNRAWWTAAGVAAGTALASSGRRTKKTKGTRLAPPPPMPPSVWAVPAPPTSALPTYLPNNATPAQRAKANKTMRRSVAKTSAQLVPAGFWNAAPPATTTRRNLLPTSSIGSYANAVQPRLNSGRQAASNRWSTKATAGGLGTLAGVTLAALAKKFTRRRPAPPKPKSTTPRTSRREAGNLYGNRNVYSLRGRNVPKKR